MNQKPPPSVGTVPLEPAGETVETTPGDGAPEAPAPALSSQPETELDQLVPLDPLRRYILQVNRFDVLDAEEEKDLALRYRNQNDQQAAYRLITSNLRVVVKVAMLYNRVYSSTMDLIQEGNIGLLEAVKRFDPFKGARLPTYATWWIKAYIIKFIMDNFRIVRVGTTNERRKLIFNLRKEKERLRLQGFEPTPQLIAQHLNVSEEDVREVEANIEAGDVSVDSPLPGSPSMSLGDTLAAADTLVEEKLARGELREMFNRRIEELAETLSERHRVILRERLLAEEPLTLQRIAERFGVTREAIRLSEKSLITKIKSYMEEALKGVTRLEIGLLD